MYCRIELEIDAGCKLSDVIKTVSQPIGSSSVQFYDDETRLQWDS